MPQLCTIIYASRESTAFSDDQLTDLLATARARNENAWVTGMLLYAHGSFMQQLEGPTEAVDDVFASIEADRRHGGVRLLSRRPINERVFANWWMGFEHPDDDSLAERLPGFKRSQRYPLVNADLVSDTTVAETLLRLYGSNR